MLVMSDTFDPVVEELNYITVLIYEYLKSYRYMIVEETTL